MTHVSTYLQTKLGHSHDAGWLLTAGTNELLTFCHNNSISEPAFFEALFLDSFPELINLIKINDDVKRMIQDYRPELVNKHGVMAYWEMLYLELISLDNASREELEYTINGHFNFEITTDVLLCSYPMIIIIFSQTVLGLQELIVKYDLDGYGKYNHDLLLNQRLFLLAVKHNKVKTVTLFLQNEISGFDFDRALVEVNQDHMLMLLIKDKRVNENTLLQMVQDGHKKIVQFLLADGRLDPSFNNNQSLKLAVKFNNLEIVKLLLNDSRTDPNFIDIDLIRKIKVDEIIERLFEDDRTKEQLRADIMGYYYYYDEQEEQEPYYSNDEYYHYDNDDDYNEDEYDSNDD